MTFPDLSPHFRHAILTADFTVGGKDRLPTLTISEVVPGVSRKVVRVLSVAGKREARAAAKAVGAKPWNF